MIDFIKWWFLLLLIGSISFPFTFLIFRKLHTKGYGLSKIIGLLVWGYFFWLGNSFGLWMNSRNGVMFVLFIVIVFSISTFIKLKVEILNWLKHNLTTAIFSECLFLIALFIILIIRIPNPEIIGTEKPMELAFINGINQSQYFPPQDPWLSGYSISYYYFGYIIINLMIKVLATPTGVAFNLGLIFWFGLITISSSDLLINLLSIGKTKTNAPTKMNKNFLIFISSLLAPFFILIISNSEGFLELIHSKGIFWGEILTGNETSYFWDWIDIKELTKPPALPLNWDVIRPGATWWWRASRVLQDYTISGQPREIINEFPFFSFYLGDLHPHLLAVPFVILCISTTLEVFQREIPNQPIKLAESYKNFLIKEFWIIAFIFGSLIFFNTWDFPIYFALLSIAILQKKWQMNKNISKVLRSGIPIIFTLGIMALIIYSPFLISFSSQAGGILPSLIYQTRSIHLVVMFLPLFVPITIDLFTHVIPSLSFKNFLMAFGFCAGIYIAGVIVSYVYTTPVFIAPSFVPLIEGKITLQDILNGTLVGQNGQNILSIYEAESLKQLITSSLNQSIRDPWIKILLLVFISVAIVLALSGYRKTEKTKIKTERNDVFWGLTLMIASILVLFPEIFFLRDQFGWRMNTIFKFYFQAWILFALCSSYSFVMIISNNDSWKKWILIILSLFGVFTGLVYPIFGIKEKIARFDIGSIQLDGTQYFRNTNPDEMEAVSFLIDNGCGVLVEAVGGSYSNYGRLSKFSGCQAVLGWPGHELQWRGSSDPLGSREVDIRTLYSSKEWFEAYAIIEKYNIDYVIIGELERITYLIDENKFVEHMATVFENNSIVIYASVDG